MGLGALPRDSWMRVWRRTIIVSLASAVASVIISEAIMLIISQGMNFAGVVAAFVLPLLLGTPMMFYQMLRSEQLRLANHKLQILASTDWLTACLNRRAFTSLVDAHLGATRAGTGAFLIIDADHFKVINDRYGHDRGDEVLQMIAEAIRANVREGDIVGRLGGEEFGVLLKGVGPDLAAQLAERIRRAINGMGLRAAGFEHALSVSIGGALFEGNVGFAELFRAADQRLYGAKRSGRNRIDLVGDTDEPAAALSRAAYG